MADDMEFAGRTVQMAVQKACRALETQPDELEYDIISHGASGIFGFGVLRKAKIRVLRSPPAGDAPGRHRNEPIPDGAPDGSEPDAELETTYLRMAVGEKVLRRIVDTLSPESTIHVQRNGTSLKFHLHGGNSGMLIGKRGITLDAIQTVVEKCVNRMGGSRIHVAVDVEAYLEKRRAGIVRSARKYAEKVKRSGKPLSMGYLNAQDRRAIHMALKDEQGISTQSSGEGYLKKMKIYPSRFQRTH